MTGYYQFLKCGCFIQDQVAFLYEIWDLMDPLGSHQRPTVPWLIWWKKISGLLRLMIKEVQISYLRMAKQFSKLKPLNAQSSSMHSPEEFSPPVCFSQVLDKPSEAVTTALRELQHRTGCGSYLMVVAKEKPKTLHITHIWTTIKHQSYLLLTNEP